MRVWISKYALTKGLSEVNGEIHKPEYGCKEYFTTGQTFQGFYKPGEYHETKDAAIERAKQMRSNKIASLEKQIKKLRAMEFK